MENNGFFGENDIAERGGVCYNKVKKHMKT